MSFLKLLVPLVIVLGLAPAFAIASETTDGIVSFVVASDADSAADIAEALLDENATEEQKAALVELIEVILADPTSEAAASAAVQIVGVAGASLDSASTGIPAPSAAEVAEAV